APPGRGTAAAGRGAVRRPLGRAIGPTELGGARRGTDAGRAAAGDPPRGPPRTGVPGARAAGAVRDARRLSPRPLIARGGGRPRDADGPLPARSATGRRGNAISATNRAARPPNRTRPRTPRPRTRRSPRLAS